MYPCLWIRRLNFVKMAIFPNYSTDCVIPVKIPADVYA